MSVSSVTSAVMLPSLTLTKLKYSGLIFSPPSLTGMRMMTALLSGTAPSEAVCVSTCTEWLSMTSALYTAVDQWHRDMYRQDHWMSALSTANRIRLLPYLSFSGLYFEKISFKRHALYTWLMWHTCAVLRHINSNASQFWTCSLLHGFPKKKKHTCGGLLIIRLT